MKSVTFVLMTCGELTEKDCLSAIAPFRSEIEFCEVRNVYPQIIALNQMIDLVQTEYFVPLDADMILNPDAWERIQAIIEAHKGNKTWHSILFPLWDTLTERKILALKVMRSSISKKEKFRESPTPDVEHYGRLTSLGYTCIHDYLGSSPIGSHVVKGKHFCYHKYRDVYQTYRAHNFEWDSGAFLGGTDLVSRARAHFEYFFYRWAKSGDSDFLDCIAGMMDGIMSSLEYQSKSLDPRPYLVDTQCAPALFLEWYLEKLESSLF